MKKIIKRIDKTVYSNQNWKILFRWKKTKNYEKKMVLSFLLKYLWWKELKNINKELKILEQNEKLKTKENYFWTRDNKLRTILINIYLIKIYKNYQKIQGFLDKMKQILGRYIFIFGRINVKRTYRGIFPLAHSDFETA